MSGRESQLLGRWGEGLVAQDYRRRGFQIVAAGFHSRFGEIDLIAKNDKFFVFVEVKLRGSTQFGAGYVAVDARKRAKLRTTAEFYLANHPTQLQPRFDVVEVLAPQGMNTKSPKIHYIEDAF